MKHDANLLAEQEFWRAELDGDTVITTTDGHFCASSSTKKSYPSRAAAERAAKADYAKKLRVGYLPIPEAELLPLMELVFKIGIRGEGGPARTFGEPSKNLVYACRRQNRWCFERTEEGTLIASGGDIGGEIESHTFPNTVEGWNAWSREEVAVVKRGGYQTSPEELGPIERYIKAMNERLAAQPAAAIDLPAAETPTATIVLRKAARLDPAKAKPTEAEQNQGGIRTPRYELSEGTSSKFWEIALSGRSFTTTYGRIGSAGASKTKSFGSPVEAAKEYEKLIGEKVRKGYTLVAGGAALVSPKPAREAADGNTTGPYAQAYADAFTAPVVHFIKLSPARKPSTPDAAPRATSGGRPIMAEGQAWPTCSGCGENLSLWLQFDIEPEMGICFIPGSHLLVFNCTRCNGMAMTVPSEKLPREWLSPSNPQTYRVILNRPAEREAVYPADPTVLEQHAKFTRSEEKVRELMEDEDEEPQARNEAQASKEPPRGRDGFKIGGIPARIQPWMPPRCNCGAPLGFIFQVPLTDDMNWQKGPGKALGEFLGSETFIHACTEQCSPYATIVIPDR